MSLPDSINGFRFFFEDGKLQAAWNSLSPVNATPEFEFLVSPSTVKPSVQLFLKDRRAEVSGVVKEGDTYVIAPKTTQSKQMQVPPVVIHIIGKVDTPRLRLSGAKVSASWKPPAAPGRADSYEVRLIDEKAKTTGTIRPTTEQSMEITDPLVVGQNFSVEVRALSDNSFGEWTRSASYTHLTGRLGPLLQELNDANEQGRLGLTPEILRIPAGVSDEFLNLNKLGKLLNLPDEVLHLTEAQISAKQGEISVNAKARLFGSNVPVKIKIRLSRQDFPLNINIEAEMSALTLAKYREFAQLPSANGGIWNTIFQMNSLRFSTFNNPPLTMFGSNQEGNRSTFTVASLGGNLGLQFANTQPGMDLSIDAENKLLGNVDIVGDLRVFAANNTPVRLGDVFIDLSGDNGSSIIEAGITVAVPSSGSLPASLVDGIFGAGKYTSVPVPAFAKPEQFIATANMRFDLTQESLLLWGGFDAAGAEKPTYGQIALLIKRNEKIGFLLAGVLKPENWNLTDLSPGLAGLDTLIGVKLDKAAVAITDLEDAADSELSSKVQMIPAGLPLKPGFNFFIGLEFTAGNDPLLRNAKSIINLPTTATLSGNIPADKDAAITLTAKLKNQTPLGGNQLKLLDLDFNEAQLDYIIAAPSGSPSTRAKKLKLSGKLTLTVDGHDFVFQGGMDITSNQVRARLAILNDTPFPNPLGLPSLTLERLGAGVVVDFDGGGKATRKELTLVGQVSIAGTVALKGTIGFIENSQSKKLEARLVLIQLLEIKNDANGNPIESPAALKLSDLFNKLTGLTWPDALDISLHDGELAWAPADKPAITFRNKPYQPGFQAKATATVFGVDIDFDVTVNTVAPKGMTATAAFANPIDWGFVKITGTKDDKTITGPTAENRKDKGPTISIDTNRAPAQSLSAITNGSPAVQVNLGLKLFNADCGDLALSAGKEEVRGTITLPSGAGPFSGKSLVFKWNEPKKKFTVEQWPVPNIDLPNIKIPLKKNGGTCAKVISDIFPLDGDFGATVNLTINPPDGSGGKAKLDAKVDVTYTMKFLGIPLFSVNVPQIKLGVDIPDPTSFKWSDMAEGITKGIKDNAEAISDSIMEDPLAWVAILLSVGATEILKNLTEYAVCRNNLDKVGAEAMLDGLGEALAVGAGVAGAGAAISSLGGFGSSIVSLAIPPKPAKPNLEFRDDKLLITWQVTDKTDPQDIKKAYEKIAAFKVEIKSGGELVMWPKPLHPFVHRKKGGKGSQFTVDDKNKTFTVDGGLLKKDEICSVTITAIGIGAQSEPSEEALLLLTTPSVSFENQALVVQWPSVQRLDSIVNVTTANGNTPGGTLEVARSVVNGMERAVVSLWSFPAGPAGNPLPVKVSVNARAKASPAGTSATSAPIDFTLPLNLAAPRNLSADLSPGQLSVIWDVVTSATSYQTRVLDQTGKPLSSQPTPTIQAASNGQKMNAVFAGQTNPNVLAVRAVGANSLGIQSLVGPFPARPTGLSTRFDFQELVVEWDSVPGIKYTVTLTKENGEKLSSVEIDNPAASAKQQTRIPAAALPARFLVSVTARKDNTSNKSEEKVVAVTLATPQQVSVFYDGMRKIVNLTWARVTGAQKYKLRLTAFTTTGTALSADSLGPDRIVTDPPNSPTSIQLPDDLNPLFVPSISAQVQALGSNDTAASLSRESAKGFAPNPPEIFAVLISEPTFIRVTWIAPSTSFNTSTQYEVYLDGQLKITQSHSPDAFGHQFADIPGLEQGKVYQLQMAARHISGRSSLSDPMTILLQLAKPTVRLENNTLVAEWPSVAGLTYTLNVQDEQGNTPGETLEVTRSVINGKERAVVSLWSFPSGPAGNPLRVQVSVDARTSDGVTAPRSFAAQIDLPISLGAPQNVRATISGNRIEAFWDSVPGAASFEIRILDQAGQPLSPQPSVSFQSATSAVLTGSFPNQRLRLAVRAVSGPTIGIQSIASVLIAALATPQLISVFYDAMKNTVTVTWSPVAGAQKYNVRLTPISATSSVLPVIPDQTAASPPTTIQLPTHPLFERTTFAAQVQAFAPDTASLLSAPANGFAPNPPGIVSVKFDGTSIKVKWGAPPSGLDTFTHYEVYLDEQLRITKLHSFPKDGIESADITAPFQLGKTHRVQVAARHPLGRSVLSQAQEIFLPAI